MFLRSAIFACAFVGLVVAALPVRAAIGEPSRMVFAPADGAFPLAAPSRAAAIVVDEQDWPGVRRVAADLQADVQRVTGVRPALVANAAAGTDVIVVGTLDRSAPIDALVRAGKLDVTAIRGKWEAWVTEVVRNPWPGVSSALVIAGSDKRGSIYGIYDLSQQMGVSPWYWWADVAPAHREAVYVLPGRTVHGSPAVKYRGIFLNDEAPDLTNWIREKFGNAPERSDPPIPAGVANYGHEFYARIFEVLLRLRGNYLWPAMWANAFNEDDPENARLADEYGIVMGTSHQEPMLRSQKEWDRRYQKTLGSWNYAKHPEALETFWREGIRRNRDFESLVTMGLRGANDTEMAPGGPEANRALLEHIVDRQREILREEMPGRDVPQVWCLYKEVQEFYEHGMRVPDDVTLLWAEDNWGNLRRVPTAAERARPGGAGIYYHFDYHGGPRSYQWHNTSPLPKIWEQMSLAYTYGADRVWIVNVGHFKGYEVPTEFFLNLAWNPQHWQAANVNTFLDEWAAREFGPTYAHEIAAIVAGYTKYNGRRKPELLAPTTYSLVNYGEGERVVSEFDTLAERALRVDRLVPAAQREAYYQLVLFPTLASATLNELYLAAGRNRLFGAQGRASTASYAEETEHVFRRFLDLTDYYNHGFAAGRWAHFMDQTVLGYTAWNDPPRNSLGHLTFAQVTPEAGAKLGVAVEGSTAAWPGGEGTPRLPTFDVINRQRHWIDVFNGGATPFEATLAASAPWVRIAETTFTVGEDRRVGVEIDWAKAPAGDAQAEIVVSGAGAVVRIEVLARNPAKLKPAKVQGFVEADGVIAIEPEHVSAQVPAGVMRWTRVVDYGRTLSGMRAEGPVDAVAEPGRDSPQLQYRTWLFNPGEVKVHVITGPTLNIFAGKPLRYAVSVDDESPTVVTILPADFRVQNGNRIWETAVANNAHDVQSTHRLAEAGAHTLKIWMIDPGVVVQKIVIDAGGLRPSYLGPPESLRR